MDMERSEAKQLVIGWDKRDLSLDWKIMTRPKRKWSERKGMRELEGLGEAGRVDK